MSKSQNIILAFAKLWASLKILFWRLLSCEQSSKNFVWHLLNLSKPRKVLFGICSTWARLEKFCLAFALCEQGSKNFVWRLLSCEQSSKNFVWHFAQLEQASKSFVWRLLNVSKAKKNLLMFANGFYQCSISQNCRLIGCVHMLTFRTEFSKIDADDIYPMERFLGIFCAQSLKFRRKFVYQS